MRFYLNEKPLLQILPLSLGTVDESSGIVKKCRVHKSLDDSTQSLEQENIIPFGSEPKITRKIEIVGNHAKVAVNLELRRSFTASRISVDSLFLPGKWSKFGIIGTEINSTSIPKVKWRNIEDNPILHESKLPFLLICFESVKGEKLEIGTGNDLWRWLDAENEENCSSLFKIEKVEGGIKITRDVYVWPEDVELPRRTRLFKWYFAWEAAGEIPFLKAPESTIPMPETGEKISLDKSLDQFIFDLSNTSWHESARAVGTGGMSELPCAEAPSFRRQLKKFIRSLEFEPGTKIVLYGLEPHFCEAAAHLERPQKKRLKHWDIMSLMNLWQWANRLLAATGSELIIQPAKRSSCSGLPSIKGMTNPKFVQQPEPAPVRRFSHGKTTTKRSTKGKRRNIRY
jgi:hypothetical protein